MKKLIFVVLALLCLNNVMFSQNRYAKKKMQSTYYGMKLSGGIITTKEENSQVGNESDYVVHEIKYSQASPMMSAGFFAQKSAGFLFYQANLLYTNYNVSYNVTSYDNRQVAPILKEYFHYIDFEVFGGLNINNFRIGVGPVVHVLAGHNSELTSIPEYQDKIKGHTFGFKSGLGYNIDRYFIDLKYENSFRTVGDHIYYGNRKSTWKGTPSNVTLSFGVGF